MIPARTAFALLAASGLLAGCKQTTQAAPVTLTTPACPEGQTVASTGSGWGCLDLATTAGIAPTHAQSAANATVAERADFADDAGSAALADTVTVTGPVILGGNTNNALDTFQVVGSNIIHDGNPVPATGTLGTIAIDAGVDSIQPPVTIVANRKAHVTATGRVTGPGTALAPTTCSLRILDVQDPNAPKVIQSQDVTTFNSADGGTQGGSDFVVTATEGPFTSDTNVTIDLQLYPKSGPQCAFAPTPSQILVEVY